MSGFFDPKILFLVVTTRLLLGEDSIKVACPQRKIIRSLYIRIWCYNYFMEVSTKEGSRSQGLGQTENRLPRKCTMCKFVLLFAFFVLLFVSVFAFISRPHILVFKQIPTQITRPMSSVEMDQRTLDLKGDTDIHLEIPDRSITHPEVKSAL